MKRNIKICERCGKDGHKYLQPATKSYVMKGYYDRKNHVFHESISLFYYCEKNGIIEEPEKNCPYFLEQLMNQDS